LAARQTAWPKKGDAMRRVLVPEQFPEQAQLTTLDEVEQQTRSENESAAREWPLVTSECIATDRVYWLGMGNAFKIMTGYGVSGQGPAGNYSRFGGACRRALVSACSDANLPQRYSRWMPRI